MDKKISKNHSLNGLECIIPENKKTLKPKDIRRLMSKLIIGFCRGTIKSEQAKTLTYLCSQFIVITQAVELEERLTNLEKRYNVK